MRRNIIIIIFLFLLLSSLVLAYYGYSDYNDPLTYSIADNRYCSISAGCGGNSGFSLYIDSSLYKTVILNISKAEEETYIFYVHSGEQYVFGEDQAP